MNELVSESTYKKLNDICNERDFFRLQLKAIKAITEETHKGKERAYTALSLINELCVKALSK